MQPLLGLAEGILQLVEWAVLSSRLLQLVGSEQFVTAIPPCKEVLKHLIALLAALATATAAGQADQQLLDSFSTLAASTCCTLLKLAAASASACAADDPAVPKDLRSLKVLNMLWHNLVNLIMSLSGPPVAPLLPLAVRGEVLQHLLRCLGQGIERMVLQYDNNKYQVARFWCALTTKLIASHPHTGAACLTQLCDLVLSLFSRIAAWEVAATDSPSRVPPGSEGATCDPPAAAPLVSGPPTLRSFVTDHVTTKMISSLVVALCGAAPAAALEHMQQQFPTFPPAPPQPGDPQAPASQEAEVYPRVLLAVSLLQKAVVADPGPFQDACARHLLPWLLDASAMHLYHKMVEGYMQGGLAATVRHSALAFLLWAASIPTPPAEPPAPPAGPATFHLAIVQLLGLAFKQHHLLQALLQDILQALLLRCPPAAATQLALALLQLLPPAATLALAADMDAASSSNGSNSNWAGDVPASGLWLEAVAPLAQLLAQVLQVLPEAARRSLCQEVVSSHLRAPPQAQLDLCAVAAAAAQLQAVASLPELSAQDWQALLALAASSLQQVQALLQEGSALLADAEKLLLHRLVAAHLELAATAAEALSRSHPEALASPDPAPVQACIAASASILQSTPAADAPAPVGHPTHLTAPSALRLLAAAAAVVPLATWAALVPPLQAALQDPRCCALVALLCPHLASVQPPPVDLFQAVLRNQSWAVSFLALDSYIRVSRMRVLPADTLTQLIPPDVCPRPIDGSCPFFVTLKAQMRRQPLEPPPPAPTTALQQGVALALRAAAAPQLGNAAAAALHELLQRCAVAAAQPPAAAARLQPALRHVQQAMEGVVGAMAAADKAVDSLLPAAAAASEAAGKGGSEEGAMLVGRCGQLLGELASTVSKLRQMQDKLHSVRRAFGVHS